MVVPKKYILKIISNLISIFPSVIYIKFDLEIFYFRIYLVKLLLFSHKYYFLIK